MTYDIDYFIKKFEAIPSEKIGVGALKNQCALWHCGVRRAGVETEEAKELSEILKPLVSHPLDDSYKTIVWMINDDNRNELIEGETPKERILNALKKVKA